MSTDEIGPIERVLRFLMNALIALLFLAAFAAGVLAIWSNW